MAAISRNRASANDDIRAGIDHAGRASRNAQALPATYDDRTAQSIVTIAAILNQLGSASHHLERAASLDPSLEKSLRPARGAILDAANTAGTALRDPDWSGVSRIRQTVERAESLRGERSDTHPVNNPPNAPGSILRSVPAWGVHPVAPATPCQPGQEP